MNEQYTSLGLMSGTSGDGVDASIIQSNGETKYDVIKDKYYEYERPIFQDIHKLKEKIHDSSNLKTLIYELKELERKITLFHAKVIKDIESKSKIDIVGFHGQTIYHNPQEKISNQLGDGNLLSQLTKKNIIYNFRQNDIKNGGEGAPLASIYHKLIVQLLIKQNKIKLPISILNIGGIANLTKINKDLNILSADIGPGNCMIDKWIMLNSQKKYDDNGDISKSGKVDKFILDQFLFDYFEKKIAEQKSLDINDFDISFARGLTLENGAATLTEITAEILSKKVFDYDIYVCGGGRKNNFLIERIGKKIPKFIKNIDSLGIDGNFLESQAFAYLAIRSFLKLPISFPNTTGCKNPCSGGVIVKNF